MSMGDNLRYNKKLKGKTYVQYDNYDAILRYNCAHYYALSVALLADQIR